MREKFKISKIIFISLTFIGAASSLGSFGFFAIGEDGWKAVLTIFIWGFFFFLVGLIGFRKIMLRNQKPKNNAMRSDLRLTEIDIERMVEDAGVIDLEQFEKEERFHYDYKYILILDIPKNAICMISKTPIEKEETVLQCPNCQNYFLSRYLIGWLNKSRNCPICKIELLAKKN